MIKHILMTGGALGLLYMASCAALQGDEETTQAFPNPLTLSQNMCSGKPNTATQTPAVTPVKDFDFTAPYPLPKAVTDHFHFEVSTESADAQLWFDTGLSHMANFNHDEAIASFRAAQEADPECAMCFWGEGLAFGSNINAGFDPARGTAGRIATNRAMELIEGVSEKEAALIRALDTRYVPDEKGAMTEAATTYAEAMAAVSNAYADDVWVLSLAAEANMDTQPWDYWEPGAQTPKGRTAETLDLIEAALAIDPSFAPAIHLYIHTTEASVDPFRAESYADTLYGLNLEAGHLVHMPSHTYFRIGKWKKSMTANVDAIAADERYIEAGANSAYYGGGYYTHNVHFAVSTAQMSGNAEMAKTMSHKLYDKLKFDGANPWGEYMLASHYFATAQFADDETVLNLPEPDGSQIFLKMAYHFVVGETFAKAGEPALAKAQRQVLSTLSAMPEVVDYEGYGVPMGDVLKVAIWSLEARIAAAEGDYVTAISLMDDAAEKQASIPYNEPAWWYYPARQTLAGYLLADGQHDRAVREFYKALIESPNNAYALYGLAEAYAARDDQRSADYARYLFSEAWAGAEGETPDLLDL